MPPPRAPALLTYPPHATMRNPSPSSISSPATRQPRTPPISLRAHAHIYPKTDASPRFFSTTTRRHASPHEPNYYEILEVPPTATPGEIKRKFYALSQKHHPDHNRNDPTASERFSRISTAYNVLRNASKRATYDHEHGFHHFPQKGAHQHPMGSHSSYSANLRQNDGSYAGSRPASGLSKRRGIFKGPPPSFYDQGGYGATGRTAEYPLGGGGGAAMGKTGKGTKQADPEDPTAFIDRNQLSHFNARGHFRTQTAEDMRRRERRSRARRAALAEELSAAGGTGDLVVRFLVAAGSLVVAVAFAGLFSSFSFSSSSSSSTPPSSTPTTSMSRSNRVGGSEGKAEKQRPKETLSGSA